MVWRLASTPGPPTPAPPPVWCLHAAAGRLPEVQHHPPPPRVRTLHGSMPAHLECGASMPARLGFGRAALPATTSAHRRRPQALCPIPRSPTPSAPWNSFRESISLGRWISIGTAEKALRVNFSIPVPRILWWYCSLYLVLLGFAHCWGNPVASKHESVKQDLAASLNVLWYWSVPIFRLKDLYELVAVALCNLHWWCSIKGLFEVAEPASVTFVSILFYVRTDSNNNNTLWCYNLLCDQDFNIYLWKNIYI